MNNHTPGPWWFDGKPGYEAPEIHAAGRRIARVLYHGGSEDNEVDANAQLIAAAPALLSALEAIVEAGRMSDSSRANYCADIARAAIKNLTISDI